MRNLVVLLHQVQPFRDNRVVLILVLADLHENLDHVLNTVAYGALVQHGTETLKDGLVGFGRVLGEVLADLAGEADGDFNGVVRWAFE